MAVTNSSAPATRHSAQRPVIFVFTSNRYQPLASAFNPTSVTDSGGDALFTKAGHLFLDGDIASLSSFATSTSYNGDWTISDRTATTFKLKDADGNYLAYDTNDVSGVVAYDNHNRNFEMKIEVIVSAVTIATKRVRVTSPVDFIVNISEILQAKLKEDRTGDINDLGAHNYDTSTPNSLVTYTVKATEEFDDLDGLKQEHDNVTSATVNGLNVTLQHKEVQSLATFEMTSTTPSTAKEFLTNAKTQLFKADSYIFLHAIFTDTTASNIQLTYIAYKDGASLGGGVIIALTTPAAKTIARISMATLLAAKPTADKFVFDWQNSTPVSVSESITVLIAQNCSHSKALYWLNNRGGVDCFVFEGKGVEGIESNKS